MSDFKSFRAYLRQSEVPPLENVCRKVVVPRELIPVINAHLAWLAQIWMWQGTPDQKNQVISAISTLMMMLTDQECDEPLPVEPCECCVELLPLHPSIEWNPDPPYTLSNPLDFDAAGKAWYTGKNLPGGLDLLPGKLDSDVFTFSFGGGEDGINLGNIFDVIEGVVNLIDEGFPRFKVRFEGTKRVQLYFIGTPAGGQALVTVDGNANPLGEHPPQLIDLNSLDIDDLQSYLQLLASLGKAVAGSLWPLKIIEIEVTGEGEHYIDVTMLPNITYAEPIPLPLMVFGGGLRKVVICGDPAECPDCPDCPEPCPECPEPEKPTIRQEGDAIEWWDGTKWVFLQKVKKVTDSSCDCDDCGCDDCDCDDCDCDDCDDCEEW